MTCFGLRGDFGGDRARGPDSKKFFGSFFQKRTACLALLSQSHLDWAIAAAVGELVDHRVVAGEQIGGGAGPGYFAFK